MKKLLSILLVTGIVVFVSCSPSKKDKEAEQKRVDSIKEVAKKRIDSLKQDSIAKIKTDPTELNLNGRVKSLTQTNKFLTDRILGFSKSMIEPKFTYSFNENGNQTEYNIINSRGIITLKKIKKYDDKGNIIEESAYNTDGTISSRNTYKYDDKGNKIEWSWYNEIGINKKITYKYNDFDKTGNWIKRTEYENGIPKSIAKREIKYY